MLNLFFKKNITRAMVFVYLSHSLTPFAWSQTQPLLLSSNAENQIAIDLFSQTDLSEQQKNLLTLQNAINANNIESLETSIFGLKQQTVILYNTNGQQALFKLDNGEVPSYKPAYTGFKFQTNDHGHLIIQAIAGADKHGQNGKVVAEHIFQGLNVATVAEDNLMVAIVEKNGRVAAISKHMLIQLAFQAPVAVFKNLNAGSSLITVDSALNTHSEFITRATKPLTEIEAKQAANLTASSHEVVSTGELLVYQTNAKGERVNITRLPTLPILAFLDLGLKFMYAASQLVSYNEQSAQDLEQVLKEISELKAMQQLNSDVEKLNSLEAELLSRFSPEQILSSLQSAKHVSSHSKNNRTTMTLTRWNKEYSDLQAEAQKQKQQKQEKLAQKNNKTKNVLTLIKSFFTKYDVLNEDDYKVTSQHMNQFTKKMTPQNLSTPTLSQSIQKKVSQILLAPKTTFALVLGGTVGFYTSGIAYDKIQGLKDVKLVSYFYENVLPDVLKDQSYRSTLILSTVIQLSLIPLVYVSSWALKSGVSALSVIYKNSTSKFGVFVKDFTTKYKSLTTSQVLLTINVRLFSLLVVSYWRVLISGMLGQKNFFTALENNQNPFKKIKSESDLGKKIGLTKDVRLGVGVPNYLSISKTQKQQKQLVQSQQEKLIELLKVQKIKLNALSWYLATAALSKKYNLTPGDIFVASKNLNVRPELFETLFQNASLKTEANQINDEIKKTLMMTTKFDLEKLNSELSAEDFANLIEIADQASQKISNNSNLQNIIHQNYLAFKKSLLQFSQWAINLGEKQRAFLQQVYPSLYTSKQVNQDFPVDQAMVTVLSGTIGEQANLLKPKYLMADANNLTSTSDMQMNSAVTNVYGHLVGSAAAQTMIYDSLNVQNESNYEASENNMIEINSQQQSLFNSAKDWFKFSVFSPTKSDIGGLAIKQYLNRINTITASLTFGVVTKILIANQSPNEAFLSFAAGFLLAHYAFGWPWGFIQAGNRFIGQTAASNNSLLKKTLASIMTELNAENSDESRLKEVTQKLVQLYLDNNYFKTDEIVQSLKQIKDSYLNENLTSAITKDKLTSSDFMKLGLIANLIEAHKSNNKEKYQLNREALIQSIYNETHIEKAEIQKLNSEGLINLAQSYSPVHTAENSAITWITSIGFGAILTTILYSNLVPQIMDKDIINAPGFLFNALKTCVEFTTVFYLTFGKKPWELYISSYNKLKQTVKNISAGHPVFEKGFANTLQSSIQKTYDKISASAVKQNEFNLQGTKSNSLLCLNLFK